MKRNGAGHLRVAIDGTVVTANSYAPNIHPLPANLDFAMS